MKPTFNLTYSYTVPVTRVIEDVETRHVKVQDIYRLDIQTPEGYEFTGEFRPIKVGEFFLSSVETAEAVKAMGDDTRHSQPRLILRKIKNYSDTEILDFVMKWLYSDVAYNGVTTKNGQYDNNPGPIYRQLVTSSFSVDNHKELREVISAEMRKKGK